jgi:hypothetical protein
LIAPLELQWTGRNLTHAKYKEQSTNKSAGLKPLCHSYGCSALRANQPLDFVNKIAHEEDTTT